MMKCRFISVFFVRLMPVIILSLYSLVAAGQSDSSAVNNRKGFFKVWKLDGISFSLGRLQNNNTGQLISLFENVAAAPPAQSKFTGDINNINGYTRQEFEVRDHYRGNIGLRFILKPRDINRKKFLSFTELSAGILHSNVSGVLRMAGHSNSGDTFSHYYTGYNFSYDNVGFDVGYTVQTPGLFGYFAFYAGPRIYGAFAYNNEFHSERSDQHAHSHFLWPERTYYADEPFAGHSDFSRPEFSAGFSVPIGIKLNIFPRWNVFFEYIFNYHVTHYSNNYTSAIWYKGLEGGLRYRFIKKERDNEEKRKGPAPPPEPFY